MRDFDCPSADDRPVNPLDALLGYQLRRASAAILADFARTLDDLSLRPTEASILILIGRNPGITQSELGRVLGIKRANMAPLAALLSDRALIDRTRPDGRSQGLRLTAAGEAVADDIRQRIVAHEARFLPELTPSDRAALVALVRRIWAD